ncbi:unnamed protein product [Urochloa humidicola]
MSANGMSRVFTPVVQAKGQQDSMNNMQNYSTGDNIRFPVTGARSFFIGGNRLPPQPRPPPQDPGRNTYAVLQWQYYTSYQPELSSTRQQE